MNAATRRAAGLAARLCAGCLILSTAHGEEYSWQVSGSYLDETVRSTATIQHRLLRATYYLSAVDDTVGPYELAPFLNRSSFVAVGAGRTKIREETYLSFGTNPGFGNATPPGFGNATPPGFGNATNPGYSNDPRAIVPAGGIPRMYAPLSAFPSESGQYTSDYAVDGRYVWPALGWYAGASARRGDSDAAPTMPFYNTTSESRRIGAFAGRYFGPRTAVEVNFASETMSQDVRMTVPGFDPLFGLPSTGNSLGWGSIGLIVDYEFGLVTDVEKDDAAISVRHVGNLGDSTIEFSASVRATRTESESRFALETPPALIGWGDPADWSVGRPAGRFPAFATVHTFATERGRVVRVSGALFPVDSLGVRLTASTSDHDAFGASDRVALSANWFFVRNAALQIELTRRSATRGYVRDARATDSLGVRLLGRF